MSSIYIVETIRTMRTSLQAGTKNIMYQLIAINVIIIIMDLALLGLEFSNQYVLQTLTKGVIYSIKLKLEFAVLNKLVKFVGGGSGSEEAQRRSRGFVVSSSDVDGDKRGSSQGDGSLGRYLEDKNNDKDNDISDFVDVTRIRTDVTHAAPSSPTTRMTRVTSTKPSSHPGGVNDADLDLARFEHMEGGRLGQFDWAADDLDVDVDEDDPDEQEQQRRHPVPGSTSNSVQLPNGDV